MICGSRGRHKHCTCGRAADFLCDWKLRRDGEKVFTCDKPICASHATKVGQDKHLCPLHVKMYEHWQKRHSDVDARSGEQQSLFQREAA
jgi:hypothetical protein